MIDVIAALARAILTGIGLLALVDPATTTGALSAAAVLVLAIALLVVATGAAIALRRGHASTGRPSRRIELHAPLTQSDPAAPGHIRRRGPGQAAPAA